MNPVKYDYKFNKGESLVSTIMMKLPKLVGLTIPCNYSKCSRPDVFPVDGDKLFAVAIENFKVMQVRVPC